MGNYFSVFREIGYCLSGIILEGNAMLYTTPRDKGGTSSCLTFKAVRAISFRQWFPEVLMHFQHFVGFLREVIFLYIVSHKLCFYFLCFDPGILSFTLLVPIHGNVSACLHGFSPVWQSTHACEDNAFLCRVILAHHTYKLNGYLYLDRGDDRTSWQRSYAYDSHGSAVYYSSIVPTDVMGAAMDIGISTLSLPRDTTGCLNSPRFLHSIKAGVLMETICSTLLALSKVSTGSLLVKKFHFLAGSTTYLSVRNVLAKGIGFFMDRHLQLQGPAGLSLQIIGSLSRVLTATDNQKDSISGLHMVGVISPLFSAGLLSQKYSSCGVAHSNYTTIPAIQPIDHFQYQTSGLARIIFKVFSALSKNFFSHQEASNCHRHRFINLIMAQLSHNGVFMSYVRPQICCFGEPVPWGFLYHSTIVLKNGKVAVRSIRLFDLAIVYNMPWVTQSELCKTVIKLGGPVKSISSCCLPLMLFFLWNVYSTTIIPLPIFYISVSGVSSTLGVFILQCLIYVKSLMSFYSPQIHNSCERHISHVAEDVSLEKPTLTIASSTGHVMGCETVGWNVITTSLLLFTNGYPCWHIAWPNAICVLQMQNKVGPAAVYESSEACVLPFTYVLLLVVDISVVFNSGTLPMPTLWALTGHTNFGTTILMARPSFQSAFGIAFVATTSSTCETCVLYLVQVLLMPALDQCPQIIHAGTTSTISYFQFRLTLLTLEIHRPQLVRACSIMLNMTSFHVWLPGAGYITTVIPIIFNILDKE